MPEGASTRTRLSPTTYHEWLWPSIAGRNTFAGAAAGMGIGAVFGNTVANTTLPPKKSPTSRGGMQWMRRGVKGT